MHLLTSRVLRGVDERGYPIAMFVGRVLEVLYIQHTLLSSIDGVLDFSKLKGDYVMLRSL